MRRIETPLGQTSVAGFGCASLGSRVGEAQGERAVAAAYAAGVAWFDVAPSYGDGNAEPILGRFLAEHREKVVLCTKVGFRAQSNGGLKALLLPLARRVISAAPSLRKYAARGRTPHKVPLTPEFITTSLESSLKRLGVEQIDVLMLHAPEPADVLRDDILATLGAARAAGKVRALGVAGDIVAAEAGAKRPDIFSVLQFANNPFEPNLDDQRVAPWRAAGGFTVTHSALGADGALSSLKGLLTRSARSRELVAADGYDPDAASTPADILIDYALASNADGVSLFSAMKPTHLAALVERAGAVRPAADAVRLGRALAGLATAEQSPSNAHQRKGS